MVFVARHFTQFIIITREMKYWQSMWIPHQKNLLCWKSPHLESCLPWPSMNQEHSLTDSYCRKTRQINCCRGWKCSSLYSPSRVRCTASESLSLLQALLMTSPICCTNANTISRPCLCDMRSGISVSSYSLSPQIYYNTFYKVPLTYLLVHFLENSKIIFSMTKILQKQYHVGD